MTQDTSFGEATLVSHIKVNKVDGRELYYRVEDGDNVEIDKETYEREVV